MAKIDSLDKLQRLDHDTLTRLESKVDFLLSSLSELKDGTAAKIADHELRLKTIERVHEEIDPVQSKKDLKVIIENQANFSRTYKIILFLLGVVFTAVGFLLGSIRDILSIFHH